MDRLAPWIARTRLAHLGLAVVLALGGWWALQRDSSGGFPDTPPVSPMVTMALPPTEPGPLVHVVGAVRRPGVYRVANGARVLAAVRKAGGPSGGADLAGVNLAGPVSDGQQIVIPNRATSAGASARVSGASAASDAPIQLSTADAGDLETLDGIGPTLAARIIEWRDQHGGFGSVEDLLEVPGIGEARLAAIESRVAP